MAFSIYSSLSNLSSSKPNILVPSSSSSSSISQQKSNIKCQFRCEFEQNPGQKDAKSLAGKDQNRSSSSSSSSKLGVGSPIIITAAPKMIKTAASVPCLRVNAGLINPGDVGR